MAKKEKKSKKDKKEKKSKKRRGEKREEVIRLEPELPYADSDGLRDFLLHC